MIIDLILERISGAISGKAWPEASTKKAKTSSGPLKKTPTILVVSSKKGTTVRIR